MILEVSSNGAIGTIFFHKPWKIMFCNVSFFSMTSLKLTKMFVGEASIHHNESNLFF
jgi:hypothetical protein